MVGHDAPQVGFNGKPGGVIDDLHAQVQSPFRDLGLISVHRNRNTQPVLQPLEHGDEPADFFGGGNGSGSRLGGLGADVQDVGALIFDLHRAREGTVGLGIFSAVGEGIRGQVQHAHEHGALAELNLPLIQFPVKKLPHLSRHAHRYWESSLN